MSPGIAPLTKRSVASVRKVAESGGATAKFTCRVDVLLSPLPEVVRCGVVFVIACSKARRRPGRAEACAMSSHST